MNVCKDNPWKNGQANISKIRENMLQNHKIIRTDNFIFQGENSIHSS